MWLRYEQGDNERRFLTFWERSNKFLVRNSGACGLNTNTWALQGVPSQARITPRLCYIGSFITTCHKIVVSFFCHDVACCTVEVAVAVLLRVEMSACVSQIWQVTAQTKDTNCVLNYGTLQRGC